MPTTYTADWTPSTTSWLVATSWSTAAWRIPRGSRSRAARTGGYLTLASLAFSPGVFAAGVDICGMSDLQTFFRDTEPWIAAAAVSKYGDPERDETLLKAISPTARRRQYRRSTAGRPRRARQQRATGEALQIVGALRRLGRPVEYLQLDGEGHEYRRADSRKILIRRMLRFISGALTA